MIKRRQLLHLLFTVITGHVCLALKNTTTVYERSFGGWSVDQELFMFIRSILPEGKTIIELGSGWTSGEFSKYYTVYSIEHNKNWINKYDTNYIYAPIKNKWFDPKPIQENLPAEYHLILVDGPPGTMRKNFLHHLDLFNLNVPIIFDDVHRKPDFNLLINVAQKLNKHYQIFSSENSIKKFGVIMP